MGDALFTIVMGGAAVLAGRLTLRAKSLIYPGYRQFGMSDDSNWVGQRIAGWLAIGFGGLILASGVIQFVGLLIG